MNIFYLDRDPRKCAEQHCNKHVCKMIIEYGQMLCTAHRVIDGTLELNEVGKMTWKHPNSYADQVLYKAIKNINHRSAAWVRESVDNYMYVYNLMLWLNFEFIYRYTKHNDHLTVDRLRRTLALPPRNLRTTGFTEPPQCMPEQFRADDTITAYRNFYIGEKIRFARYTRREAPEWLQPYLIT